MPSLFGLINLGKTGILSYQRAMSVVGENIANVHTPGYTRRRVELNELAPYEDVRYLLGSGVEIEKVSRVVDNVLEARIASQKGESGFWNELFDVASTVEAVVNEHKGLGLQDALVDFWNAWQALSVTPDGSTERDVVVQSAERVVSVLKEVKKTVEDSIEDAASKVRDWVDEVNRISERIAYLNNRIKEVEFGNTRDANNFRDEMNKLLKDLSELTGARYTWVQGKGVQVFLPNGLVLVDGDEYRTVGFEEGDFLRKVVGILNDKVYKKETSFEKEYFKLTLSGEDITDIVGGKIGGVIKGVAGFADDLLDRMENIATELIYNVNKLHVNGVGKIRMNSIVSEVVVSDEKASFSDQANIYFADRIQSGGFEIKVWDDEGNLVTSGLINISTEDSLESIVSNIDRLDFISAYIGEDGRIVIKADGNYTFSFDNDTSGFLVAFGLNTFFKGDSIDNMDVADRIKANHLYVAAGNTPNPGDNRVALDIANLAFANIFEGNQTFGEYYSSTVGALGAKVARIKDVRDDTEQFLNELVDKRESISGVNIDEEMTNLIKFQRAYEASARYITVIDEMLNTIISRMGVVGR